MSPEFSGAHCIIFTLPSGPLHIGHSRMAILNDEYVRRYGGRLILRIEDTNPENYLKAYLKGLYFDLDEKDG